MITNIGLKKEVNELIICVENQKVEKEYTIRKDYFLSKNITTGEDYELNKENITDLLGDGLYVLGIFEELLEIENGEISVIIAQLYLRNYSVDDIYKKIVKHI